MVDLAERRDQRVEARAAAGGGGGGGGGFTERYFQRYMDPNTTPEDRALMERAMGRTPPEPRDNTPALRNTFIRQLQNIDSQIQKGMLQPGTPQYDDLMRQRKEAERMLQGLDARMTGPQGIPQYDPATGSFR